MADETNDLGIEESDALKDTESEDDDDDDNEQPKQSDNNKRNYSCFIDDEAEEEVRERPEKETKYDEVVYPDNKNEQSMVVSPEKNVSTEHTDDITDDLEKEFLNVRSLFTTNIKNPYAKQTKKTLIYEGELFYEELTGGFVIIYVFAKGTKQTAYSLPAKIAIERELSFPQNQLKDLRAVQLSSKPNSNEPSETIGGYQSAYGYLFNIKVSEKSKRLEIIRSHVIKLCEFLNSHVLNYAGQRLDPGQPVKSGKPIGKYFIAHEPNVTVSPLRRRLGDIIMVNDIKQILDETFDYKNQRRFLQLFFNHPYNSLLHETFDLPIDGKSISTTDSTSGINWS